MTKKIIAFGASSSRNSINKQLATFAANQFKNAEVEILDLNDYEMPLFSVDKEKENGIHNLAQQFHDKIGLADFIIISFAEHNGAYSAAFKNIFDWISRIPGRNAWGDKPMFLMATSPGKMGGSTVLGIAEKRFPYNGGKVVETYSLPFFYEYFSTEKGIVDEVKSQELSEKVEKLQSEILKSF